MRWIRSRSRRTTVSRSTLPPNTSSPPTCMCTGPRSAWIADRSEGDSDSAMPARAYPDRRSTRVLADAALRRAEDVVPERRADAEATRVVLEVMSHVELAQDLARAGARLVVMQVV